MYPSYLEDDERWLDGTGGAGSVRATVLRSADASGLARGSDWCPGSSVGEREGRDAAITLPALVSPSGMTQDTEHHSAASSASAAGNGSNAAAHAAPLQQADAVHEERSLAAGRTPTRNGGRRRQPWRVEVTEEGLLRGCPQPVASARVADLLAAVLDGGHELSEDEMVLLFAARGADFQVSHVALCLPMSQWQRQPRTLHRATHSRDVGSLPLHDDLYHPQAVRQAADALRQRVCGDVVSYVVNRNINYTNVCTFKCQFCAFSKGKVRLIICRQKHTRSLARQSHYLQAPVFPIPVGHIGTGACSVAVGLLQTLDLSPSDPCCRPRRTCAARRTCCR